MTDSKTLKIAVSGAHSTGKTTFLNSIKERLRTSNITYDYVCDLAPLCPLPILRNHTIESALWIVSSGISHEIRASYESKVVLVDRPVLDAWAYLMATGVEVNKKSDTYQTLKTCIKFWMGTYSIVYKTVVDKNTLIPTNVGRYTNEEYRMTIDNWIEVAMEEFNISPRLLTIENSSQEINLLIENIVKKDEFKLHFD